MTGTAGPLRVCVIGELRVEHGADVHHGPQLGSRKGRIALAVLAVAPGRRADADQLAEALWPEGTPAQAASVVASLISRLRRTLGADVITGGRSHYRLGAAVEVDLDVVAGFVAEAQRRAEAQPALAGVAGRAALSLLAGGPVLAGEPDAGWADAARERHTSLQRRARHLVTAAALTTGDPRGAREVAAAAAAADPLDEEAARGQMAALAATGDAAAALTVYARLRIDLADQLGADPSPATRQLHEAILRGDAPSASRARPSRPALLALAGRGDELADLQSAWAQAAATRGSIVLLTGLPGAGKTRLAEELAEIVATTGGTVLSARCYEAERGLFLQPFVEAISAAAATWPAARIRAAATEHLDSLARLVPEVRAATGEPVPPGGPTDVERRRSVEAVSAFLCGVASSGPVLLVLDDLHNAGESTIELLHYLRTRIGTAPLLVVGTLRSAEGAAVLSALRSTARPIQVGALPAAAVASLAAASGQAHLAIEITRRTGGHALFVIEILRGLATGTPLPASLQDAVAERLATLGTDDAVLRAGAVLGSAFEPTLAADVAGITRATALRDCERALAAGLLVAAGRHYEFANDVLREVIYEITPAPSRLAWHARAADLLPDRPEQLAEHARAIDDWPRAARAWLLAGEQALERYAAADADALAGRALSAAQRSELIDLQARAFLIRGRARYVMGRFAEAWKDLGAATDAARAAGDRRLEMTALRERAHDVHVGLGYPPADTVEPLNACLAIARSLGDRATEADLLSRLAVQATGRLDFVRALELGEQALRVGRAAGQRRALIPGLDAIKTPLAYLGLVDRASAIIEELEPLARAEGDLFRLQWTIFESFVAPLAAEDYPTALARVDAALAVNRRTGHTSFAPFFLAYRGWVHRLRGDLPAAAEVGASAVAAARAVQHGWWGSTAAAVHAMTLLALGRGAEAVDLLETTLAAVDLPGNEAYRLRCLAALAAVTGSAEILAAADDQLRTIVAPEHCAWLLGADAYVGIAHAWAARGERGQAREVLAPMRAAALRFEWPALVRLADSVVGA